MITSSERIESTGSLITSKGERLTTERIFHEKDVSVVVIRCSRCCHTLTAPNDQQEKREVNVCFVT